MCNFYEKLFSSNSIEDNDIDRYLKDCKINPLTENDKNLCDSFPILDECKDAVMKNLKANKSPGLDGIPNEFYQTFWKDISHLFYGMLKEIYINDTMSYSQKLAMINTDYKIIAFIFARRLQLVIR